MYFLPDFTHFNILQEKQICESEIKLCFVQKTGALFEQCETQILRFLEHVKKVSAQILVVCRAYQGLLYRSAWCKRTIKAISANGNHRHCGRKCAKSTQ